MCGHTDDGKTKEVARLGAGDFFGEMALLTGEDRTATVIALVDTYLFELTQADIAPLIGSTTGSFRTGVVKY